MNDARNPNDMGRIMDSMFRPREFAGSRRGRVLVVLSAFLGVETALLITQIQAGANANFAWALWTLWLVCCVLAAVVPQFGADQDTPAARRTTAVIAVACAVVGLSVFGAIALLGHSVPSYWLMIVAAVTVAVSTAHLGVRAFTS